MALTIALYKEEQAKSNDRKRKMGYRAACTAATKSYYQQHKVMVKLCHNTLFNLVNGNTVAKADFNSQKSWLSKEEADEVIGYVIEMAAWGFGLDHQRLKEHVDKICHARYGSWFPKEGVGRQWTYRFMQRYSDRLHVYTARPLHDVRGKAANPKMTMLWQNMVEETQLQGDNGKLIAPECSWARGLSCAPPIPAGFHFVEVE